MSNPLAIVDVTTLDAATGNKVFEAANSQGFLFIEGHGFSQEEVDFLFSTSKEFFDLPAEDKEKIPWNFSNHGYVNYGVENLDPLTLKKGDPKEALNVAGLNCLTGISNREMHAFFRNDEKKLGIITSTIQKLYQLNMKLLKLLALGLQIEDDGDVRGEDWFKEKYDAVKPLGTTFRLLHYLGQKKMNAEVEIRAGAHTDYGSITLLFQQLNQEGLEIYSPATEDWLAVPSVPASSKFPGAAPPIVVNIADQLSYWSCGLLKSTLHRVRFPKSAQQTGEDRYSIAFFSHPNENALLEPFPSPLTRDIAGDLGAPITAGEHLRKRLSLTHNT